MIIETLYTLISPGTELRCLAGQEYPEFPFILGYSAVGRIKESGPGCTLPVGQLVFCGGTKKSDLPRCWGAHCRHSLADEASLYLLPAGIDPLAALPAKLAAIAYHGARVARPQPHENVAVVGLGPIGHLAVLCHSHFGASTVGVDTEGWRVERMKSAGASAVVSSGSIAAAVVDFFGQHADLVVDATGVAAALPQCIEAAKTLSWQWNGDTDHGARVLIQGSYPADVSIPYKASFNKELKFLLTRDSTANDVRQVIELISTGNLSTAGVISDVVQPENAPQAYQRLLDREKGLLTVAFDWRT